MAVDLGTTKVAGFLVDLETGATVASEATMNPQIPYGEDVMSRLSYCEGNSQHGQHMASLLIACVNRLLTNLLSKARADAVADALKSRMAPGQSIQTEGRAETEPVASNESAEGRAQNRRVEIIVFPAAGGV